MVPDSDQILAWVKWYVTVASLLCTFAMAADVFQSFRSSKLWFPCRYFTINSASITLITITMKLLIDITSKWPGMVKLINLIFLFTMLANFLPSLGGMNDKELFTNIMALGILITTIILKLYVQEAAYGKLFAFLEMSVVMFFLLWPFCVALIVPTSRKVLEAQYQKLHKSDSSHQEKKFSYEELTRRVKKYWIMAETGNPQFALACSPFCSASRLVCSLFATISFFLLVALWVDPSLFWDGHQSHDIRSITVVISIVQSCGILVGSIAPIIRCIATATYFNPTISSSIKRINMFRIETHSTQKLQQWKDIYITSYISGRHCKIVFNYVKNMILNICMALQIILVVICKTICLFPSCVMLSIFSCCHYCNSLLISQKKVSGASNHDDRSEIEGYRGCVLRIEEDAELTDRRLRNMLRSIKKVLEKSEKKQPENLMKFLKKSSVLSSGVLEFHNNQALPFCKEETNNCWSLVAVTLTTIAISLPNIAKVRVMELLARMGEGLKLVSHIEETLYAKDELVGARKTARRIWIEAEVYRKWLEIKLQYQARKGEPSRKILEWLSKEAVEIENSKKINADDSHVIAAKSMHRISETILLIHCKNENNWPTDMELFEWISTVIADLLWACLTNLPRVIALNCYHDAIEKRGDNTRSAARLLGESKSILDILEKSQFEDLDQESMAYIGKWQATPKSQISTTGGFFGHDSTSFQ